MDIPSITSTPAPIWLMLLLPLLAPVWFLARRLANGIGETPAHDQAIALGLFGVTWLGAVHLAAHWLTSFHHGLLLATLLLATLGIAAFLTLPAAQRRPLLSIRNPLTRGETWLLVGMVLLFVPSFYIGEFWDRKSVFSHHAFVSQMLNGDYPPRDPTFVSVTLPYHYGVDTFYAMWVAITRIRQDIVMDAVSLALWAYCLVMLALIGRACFGEKAGAWAMLAGGLAGGMRLLGDLPEDATFAYQKYLFARDVSVGDLVVNYPFASYVFQSPFIIGTAEALLMLLLVARVHRDGFTPARGIALVLIILALGFCNTIWFLTTSAAVLGGAALLWLLGRDRRHLYLFLAVAVGMATLPLTSSFFGGSSDLLRSKADMLEFARYGVAGNADHSAMQNLLLALKWNLVSFGLLLVLGGIGLYRNFRAYPWLLFLFGGCFVIVNALAYTGWPQDINKFAGVAAMVLGLFAAPVLRDAWRSRAARLPVLGLLLVLSWDALGLVGTTGWLRLNNPDALTGDGFYSWVWRSLGDDDKQAMRWLRGRVQPGELVLRAPDPELCPDGPGTVCVLQKAYGMIGGLPQPWMHEYVMSMGFTPEAIARGDAFVEALPGNKGAWVERGVRWLVAKAGDDAWFDHPSVVERVRFGSLRIGELTP